MACLVFILPQSIHPYSNLSVLASVTSLGVGVNFQPLQTDQQQLDMPKCLCLSLTSSMPLLILSEMAKPVTWLALEVVWAVFGLMAPPFIFLLVHLLCQVIAHHQKMFGPAGANVIKLFSP